MTVDKGPSDRTRETMRLIENEGRAKLGLPPISDLTYRLRVNGAPTPEITTEQARVLVGLRQVWASRPGQEH